jgi:hypothetical protein
MVIEHVDRLVRLFFEGLFPAFQSPSLFLGIELPPRAVCPFLQVLSPQIQVIILYFLDYGLEVFVQFVAQSGPLLFLLSKRGGLLQFFCNLHLEVTLPDPDYPLPLGLMLVCKTVLAYSAC